MKIINGDGIQSEPDHLILSEAQAVNYLGKDGCKCG